MTSKGGREKKKKTEMIKVADSLPSSSFSPSGVVPRDDFKRSPSFSLQNQILHFCESYT